MTRGTAYAALEIILWLLASGIGGFLIGWLLRRWIVDRHVGEQIHALRTDEERRRSKLQLEVTEWETKAAAMAADLDRRTADLDRAKIQVGERDKALAVVEADMSDARSREMKLQSKVEDRESTIASLRASIGKEDKQLAALKRDLDSANGTVGTLRKDAEGYRATIEALRADLDVERHRQKNLSSKLETATDEAATAAASLAAARTARENLQTRLNELEDTRSDDSYGRLVGLEAELAAATQERDRLAALLGELQATHAECADEPSPPEAPIDATPEPEAGEEQPDPADLPEKDLAVAKVAEIAVRTRGKGPIVEDDLKKIHGVGPKLDGLLKSMDITSFRQVANFTAEDIRYVTAALDAFPGRIERDDWMTSAAEQHAAKYNEPA